MPRLPSFASSLRPSLDLLTPKASAQAGTPAELDPFSSFDSAFPPSASNSSSHRSSRPVEPFSVNLAQLDLGDHVQNDLHVRKRPLDSDSSSIINTTEDSIPPSHAHDHASGLKTPMPASPRGANNPNFFSNPHHHSRATSSTTTPRLPASSQPYSTNASSCPSVPSQKGMATSALKAIEANLRRSEFSFTSSPTSRIKNSSPGPSNPPPPISTPSPSPASNVHSDLQTSYPLPSASPESESGVPLNDPASVPVTITPSQKVNSTSSDRSTSKTSSTPKSSLALPPKGLLSVKIVSARRLKYASSYSRPYVVAQFDNNEFVSREPIGEEESESKGVANLSRSRETDKNIVVGSADAKLSSKHTISPSFISSNGNGSYCLSGQTPIWKQEVDFDVAQHHSASSLCSTLHVSVYDRSIGDLNALHSPNHSAELGVGNASSSILGIEGVEMFLGETVIELDFEDLLRRKGGWLDEFYKLTMKDPASPIEAGEIRIQLRYQELKSKKSLDVSDFEFLKMIGRGTFGRVFQVRKKDTKRIYAMKVLSKKEVIDKKEVQHTIGERNILQQSNQCPFLLGLKFSFQSPGELFLVMDYKSGGELFHHLQKEGRFTEERARFYTAEIVLALEHLHKFNIVYRDLKPENILLDATGHIVLCDFGLSKPNLSSDELTTTFCGTTEYLAPEVLLDDHGYSKLVDFWSLGVLLFEMCCGWSPFYAEDNQQMYKNICFGKIKFPRGVIGDDGKQFVKGLLNRNPKHRLGAQDDAEDLKRHAFFKTIDWQLLETRQIVPSFKPHIDSDDSVANFDTEFTQLNIEEQLPMTMKKMKAEFDENDRSADWLKQASSYHQNSSLHNMYGGGAGGGRNNSFGQGISKEVISGTQHHHHLNSSKGRQSNPTSTSPAPRPVPVTKNGHSCKNEDEENLQDHFLGFSYHGESELGLAMSGVANNSSSKFGMTRIE